MYLILRYFPAIISRSSLVIDGKKKIPKVKQTVHRGQVVLLDLCNLHRIIFLWYLPI